MELRKKNKKEIPFIFKLAILLVFGYLTISFCSNAIEIQSLNSENQLLLKQQQEIEAKNKYLESVVSGDKKEYMELIARDKLGYAYPDEKIFYDITPGDQ